MGLSPPQSPRGPPPTADTLLCPQPGCPAQTALLLVKASAGPGPRDQKCPEPTCPMSSASSRTTARAGHPRMATASGGQAGEWTEPLWSHGALGVSPAPAARGADGVRERTGQVTLPPTAARSRCPVRPQSPARPAGGVSPSCVCSPAPGARCVLAGSVVWRCALSFHQGRDKEEFREARRYICCPDAAGGIYPFFIAGPPRWSLVGNVSEPRLEKSLCFPGL